MYNVFMDFIPPSGPYAPQKVVLQDQTGGGPVWLSPVLRLGDSCVERRSATVRHGRPCFSGKAL